MNDEVGRGRRPGETTPGVRERLRYRFDNLLARGTSATLIWLGAITLAAVLVSSLLLAITGVALTGSEGGGWLEDLWQSLLRVMDAGTMAGDVGWGRRVLALLITIFGLLVAGTLIGIIAAGVEDRIDNMRRGRSVVIESDHVVVLGASDRLPVLLNQLELAAVEGGSRTIVVLADLDPAELHAAARDADAGTRAGVRVVFRSGDPTVPDDLALVRLGTARGAIVLSDRHSDVRAVETVLSVASELGGLDGLTVVVELLEPVTAAEVHRAYGDAIHTIVTSEAIARTSALALRQRGLAQVVRELLDFRGCDLHIVERPEFVGASFGRLVRGLANARPIGLLRADGRVDVCPSFDAQVEPGDRLAVIAGDVRELVLVADGGETAGPRLLERPTLEPIEEHLIAVGWNDLGSEMLAGWAIATAPTSALEVVVDQHQIDPATIDLAGLGPISATVTGTADVVANVVARRPTTVVLLAAGDPAAADVRTILALGAMRREFIATDLPMPRFVVELNDAAHEALVRLDGPDDLIISDAMGSQFIAQLVDQPARRDVLLELYSAEGASLRMIPCERFDLAGDRSFGDVVERVASFGLLAIGWRASGESAVKLDAHLADRVRLGPGDELIVVG